jgi:hypothetical protein
MFHPPHPMGLTGPHHVKHTGTEQSASSLLVNLLSD